MFSAIALVLLLGAASASAQSTSPGPLARSHARWDNQCAKCHQPGKGVTDERCLDCHKEAKRSRFHWQLAKDAGKGGKRKPCAKCHRDHQGRGFRMIRWQPPKRFDHSRTGWRLKGRHARTACRGCHKKPHRWMGESSTCRDCHTDVHKPSLGGDCASCHDEQRFAPARGFHHDRARFKLRGAHREVDCVSCHKGRGAKGQYRGLSFASCASCHSDPVDDHSRGLACEQCHTERSWQRVKKGAGLRLHGRLDFKLVGKHRPVPCAKCHTARKKGGATPALRLGRFEGLKSACVDCHKDPHRGTFGTGCDKCHSPSGWRAKMPRRRAPKGFDHARTGFALQGRHARVACDRCHTPSLPYKRRYRGLAHERCVDCHADVHPGEFKSVADQQRCEACHTEAGFVPAMFASADHAKARWQLTGAHRVVPCASCHTPDKAERGRSLGRIHARSPRRVARLVGTPTACADCHKSPHGAQFDGRSPALTCTSCHVDTAFAPASRFDHDATGFKLEGPHRDAPCAACHTRAAGEGDTAKAPVRYAGVTTACAGCHSDVHRGQFDSGGPKRTCDDCHTVVKGFAIARFDHDKTRFPLRGKHEGVDCARCHTKVQVQGKETVHYRLGPLPCSRCHENPHSRRGRGKGASAAGRGTWSTVATQVWGRW